MTIDAADPGRGDPWGISAAALQRSVKAITVRAAENSVREAVSEASGEVWAGRARDAFVHTASILADDLGRLASRWDAEASALTAYARGVQAVKDQQQTLTHRRELAEEDIDGWRREQRTAERENLTAMAVGNGAALDDDRPRLLESRINEAEDELALVTRQWGALIDERAAVNGSLLSALGEEKVTGPYGTVSGSMAAANGLTMDGLTRISPGELAALLAMDPTLLDRLLASQPPDVVSAWWANLSDSDQQGLLVGAPALVGALNGIPAMIRAAANRTLAARQLKAFRDAELFDPNRPPSIDIYPTGNANMIDYLQRVVDGDVQLYLWRPDKDEVIEMFGNPDTADVIMSFMPGTNTTMDSFYTATATTGITALTRWGVENARAGTSVAGLVVKQGAFPQLGGNIFATGPQNNDMAEELGAKYADSAAGIHVITPGTPVVSVEHSFGSSVGGVAETQDAGFHTRITLSGIGMTSDYGPSLDTDHYAMRSPNDILDQLHVKETQIFNWGYQHAPTPENGFTELDSGIPGTPAWAQIGKVISPPIAIGDLASGLDHHNQIISGDISENRVVLETINDVIWNAAR